MMRSLRDVHKVKASRPDCQLSCNWRALNRPTFYEDDSLLGYGDMWSA
jgi:hypothetical protein